MYLTLTRVGFLWVHFEMGCGTGKITALSLKLVTIMLNIWNLVRKYTHICSFRNYTFYYQDPLNFADVSTFLQKINIFWQK